MLIQINTDNTLENNARLQEYFSNELETSLARFSDRITRIDVHFGDENGEKFANDDKRCLIEARLAGIAPITATHHAATLETAFQGAVAKLKTLLSKLQEKEKEY